MTVAAREYARHRRDRGTGRIRIRGGFQSGISLTLANAARLRCPQIPKALDPHPRALMAGVGLLVSALALFQLVRSFG
jgi:hypothetical protein